MAQPDLYAVVGDPIAHSKSPLIHRLFAEQTGENLVYEAIRIDSDDTPFPFAISRLQQQGYRGLNITVPYKLSAFELADEKTQRAETAQAVNTFAFREDGTILGDNTDGIGLVNDIQNNAHRPFKGQSVLILGAGGAVQGVLQPILEQQPASIHIANRTSPRAQALAKRFADNPANTPLTGSGWEDIPSQPYDIIINGTAASLEGKLLPIPPETIGADSLVYDMMYADQPTCFLQWAKEQQPGCDTRDGLGMLVEQAAEAFALWRNLRPQTQPVIETVRQLIQSS
jgi:shikimate dehydrogenase